jgi:hypothetical protein
LIKSSHETTNNEKIDVGLMQTQIHKKYETDAKSIEDPSILKSDVLKLLDLYDGPYKLNKQGGESIIALLKGGAFFSIMNLVLLGYLYMKTCQE